MSDQKFNILIDPLPLSVELGGRDFVISADFRTSILFEQLMQDTGISRDDKIRTALALYFPDGVPVHLVQDACLEITNFYCCGSVDEVAEEGARQQKATGGKRPKRIYDYDYDAPYIYAAFLDQYGIDLQDIEFLHWWKFHALFLGLKDDNEICKIMSYRAVNLADIKNRSERQRYATLQARYRLPDTRTLEEKQATIGALFGGAF